MGSVKCTASCRKVQRRSPCAGAEVIRACLSREYILLKRNSFVYVFKAVQVGVTPGSLGCILNTLFPKAHSSSAMQTTV